MHQPLKTLSGRRILIVEDEYYLADDLARALRAEQADVIGPVATLDDAEAAAAGGDFDLAVIDINLRGDMAFSVSDRLMRDGIPFVIATGYDSESLPARFADVPRIEKPYDSPRVLDQLAHLVEHAR